MSRENRVLCLQDTTELDFTSQPGIAGLGRLSYERQHGMYLHPTLAVSESGVALGILDAWMWARQPQSPVDRTHETDGLRRGCANGSRGLRYRPYLRVMGWLRTPACAQESYRFSYGICDDQLSLRFKDFKQILSPVPPLHEQQAIVTHIEEELSEIDSVISRAQRDIELMREYRTRLISDVVTGQVDVRGIEVPEVAGDELLALEEDADDFDDVIDDEGVMDESD